MADEAADKPTIIQWIIDTTPLWPEAQKTKDLELAAARALALLTPPERAAVLRFYHVRDAKLSLASHLVKRHAIARFCRVPWAASLPVRDSPTSKPVWRDASGRQPLVFNVSHQAGIVALFAVAGYRGARADDVPDVGVDVVSPLERRDRDLAMLAADGWARFVDVHAEVFSPHEVAHLKHGLGPALQQPGPGPRSRDDVRLRHFYALWCLREAYVKMTGEALLAPWLGELEFRGFRPPAVGEGVGPALRFGGGEETVVKAHEVHFKGRRVEDTNVCLKALGSDYMVSAAVRTPDRPAEALGWELGAFESLSVDDIVAAAEASGGLGSQ